MGGVAENRSIFHSSIEEVVHGICRKVCSELLCFESFIHASVSNQTTYLSEKLFFIIRSHNQGPATCSSKKFLVQWCCKDHCCYKLLHGS